MHGYRTLNSGLRNALAIAGLVGACLVVDTALAQQQVRTDVPMVVSGGVGLESRGEMAQKEREANLKLVFTEPQGSYLSNIDVTVYDRQGNVMFNTDTTGPLLLARLAPGTYKVVARDAGTQQQRVVTVGSGLRTEHFRMSDQGGIPGRPIEVSHRFR